MQNATDMLADKVAYEDALREFDSNYRQTHQGVSARDAEEAYAQFHWAQHDRLQQKWGGNPFLMQGVDRMVEGIRQPSMQRAVAYRDQQEGIYKKSQLDASAVQTLRKFSDPSLAQAEKEAALRDHERSLRLFGAGQTFDPKTGQWVGGTDITADIMAFREKAARADIEGRIAAGDFEGAKLLVNRYGGGGSTSERNLAANNFGNVKNTSGSYNAYATRHDGLMGVGERVLRYSNAPERGWHATTLRQMVGIYAPASDGNDPAGYAAWLGKHLGIGPDEKVNFRDPKILAGLIRHMPVMEHGAKRVSVSEEEAMRAAQALLAGKKPNITGQAAVSGGAALSPEETAKFKQTIDALDHKKQVNDFLAGTAGLSAPERMALLEEQYGGKPEAREQYDAIRNGIMHDVSAQDSIKQFERKERKNSLLKKMESFAGLEPEQSFAKMQEIAQSLPLDERDDFYKAANNLRNPGRHDDPLAVQEITERLLNGEDVYVLAEYGPRLSPATAKKLGNQAYQQALPTIKSAFDDAGNEFFGNSSNKTHAQGMGVPNMTAMWTHFLNQTDADEKMDIPRLRKEAQDFFKPFVLNKPWSAFNVHTIRGLQDRALKMYAGSWPEQGTEEYGIATNFLKEQKVEPESVFGKYTDEQLAKGYRQYRSMKRGGNPDGAGK